MAIWSVLIALDVFGLLLCLIGIIDAKRRPDWAWQASGQNKSLWVVLNVLGFIFGMGLLAGLIIGLIYFLAIRPKVALAQKGGGPMGGVGQYGRKASASSPSLPPGSPALVVPATRPDPADS